MENQKDTSAPGIDKDSHKIQPGEAIPSPTPNLHSSEMKQAVAEDRQNYEDPENPRQKYALNINDQASSQSSSEDYVKTHSKFLHANEQSSEDKAKNPDMDL